MAGLFFCSGALPCGTTLEYEPPFCPPTEVEGKKMDTASCVATPGLRFIVHLSRTPLLSPH